MRLLILSLALLLSPASASAEQATAAPQAALLAPAAPASASRPAPGPLTPDELATLMPTNVFFNRRMAPVQLRNSAGFRFPDGHVVLAGLVDTSGYSTAERDRYQFYLLTDAPLQVSGHPIGPGAYGAGFLVPPALTPAGLLLLDLGGNELFHAPTTADDAMRRPRPLQILPGASPAEFRLYLGRSYVTLRQRP